METTQSQSQPQATAKPAAPGHKLKVWVEHTYPEELHIQREDIGYYATANSSATNTEEYERYAKLMYYAGWGNTAEIEPKLQAATKYLDLYRLPYTWSANGYGFKFLLVDTANLPNPE